MDIRVKGKHWKIKIFILILSSFEIACYEKTLRKIVRSQSKMVQRPFSDTNADQNWRTSSQSQDSVYPRYAQIKSVIHKMQRPKVSTILSSVETGKSKSMFSMMNIAKNQILHPYELRMARDAITDALTRSETNSIFAVSNGNELFNTTSLEVIGAQPSYEIPTSNFFPPIDEKLSQRIQLESSMKGNSVLTSDNTVLKNSSVLLNSTVVSSTVSTKSYVEVETNACLQNSYDIDLEKTDFVIEKVSTEATFDDNSSLKLQFSCTDLKEAKVDIDAQDKFMDFDTEPSWIVNNHFWNHIYESRYEALMRNPKWPALKVILVPRTHVDTIWKQPFDSLHNNTVRNIISNLVKKLQFYSNLTFSWNEVSHLSQWWKDAPQKSRKALRRLVEEGRLEITTGGWVETEEATSHIFGILHQLIEGHQWLQYHLNYAPDVAWLTNSVTHSPTLPYLLSASGISNLVVTNLHYSWQQYLTEYQYTDLIWVQSWDTHKTAHTNLNEALNRIGNDRYPKHSVITHYLQFNSAGYKACGPQSHICMKEFNFADPTNNEDINTFNVKEKSEKLLEQYSKTGTTSSHNVLISPLGDQYNYQSQTEFDVQYNNYQKIADYININHNIYKATIEFGIGRDYFKNVLLRQNRFPTVKGDFLNFADINDGRPAYWTGFFTTRPLFKSLLRRLQSTLRSTEILFSFALNLNAFKSYKMSKLYELLLKARESAARLQDRNAVGGTLTAEGLRNAHQEILNTARECWYIQETAASLLSAKPNQNETYLQKYVYRDGEFLSSFKSVAPGDQIYVFNSLNHERVEIVELITRYANVKIVDHDKKEVAFQINPVWKFGFDKVIRISGQFFKIMFVAEVPPLAFVLFKIEETYDTHGAATIYCTSCSVDEVDSGPLFPFTVQPLQTGDIQLKSHKHLLIFDEHTGFLKTVVQTSDNNEKTVVIEFAAFKSAHSDVFVFNTNISNFVEDILSPFRQNGKSIAIVIVSGKITTELSSLYGNLLHHTVKIFNIMSSPLADVIKLETKLDYDVVSKNGEMELFLSIQTDISNGNPPQLFVDNNGFQYTARTINVSGRVESNVYPFTSLVYIQNHESRATVVTDYAHGVTVLQEGQLIVMLDRVVFDDDYASNKEVVEKSVTSYTHYLLLESFIEPKSNYDDVLPRNNIKLPSHAALYLANNLNYHLDVYFIDTNRSHLCHYAFKPLIKSTFPCDVTMINYRTVLNRGTPEKYTPNTALMTLHRQHFSCRIKWANNLKCSGDSWFSLDKILRNIKAVYQTNLVGTTVGIPVNDLNKYNFPPMELTTLRIYF